MTWMDFWRRLALLLMLLGLAIPARAQTDWPAGPVRVSVPFPPGGTNDIVAIVELNGFPHVKAGKLRLLAMFAEQRHPDFPDVPTLNELGYKQVNTPIWQGFYAPPGVPAPIREKLNRAVAEISARPDMKEKLLALGFATRSMPLDELRAFYLADDALYKKIIQEAKITID